MRLALFLASLAFPVLASAHQPVVVEGEGIVRVREPEVSKAYYDELKGEPRLYVIDEYKPFTLYLNLLTPLPSEPDARFGASIDRVTPSVRERVGSLALTGEWKEFHEEYGGDDYLQGPEFRRDMPAGKYEILVSGWNGKGGVNDGRYALAVGEREVFGPAQILDAYFTVPRLKAEFFGTGRASFMNSPYGLAGMGAFVVLGGLAAYLFRRLLRLVRSGAPAACNIGGKGRGKRLLIACGLVLVGILLWSNFLFALAGATLYEALFGWCALRALPRAVRG